jgi:hypothetical protein
VFEQRSAKRDYCENIPAAGQIRPSKGDICRRRAVEMDTNLRSDQPHRRLVRFPLFPQRINEERSGSDYSEFDLVFKEALAYYKNGSALVVSSQSCRKTMSLRICFLYAQRQALTRCRLLDESNCPENIQNIKKNSTTVSISYKI